MVILSISFPGGLSIFIHHCYLLSKGLNTHQRAIDENVATHGVSVHLVTAALDEGPMIAQASLPLMSSDTADSLAARVLKLEHHIYPFVLFGLAEVFVVIAGRRGLENVGIRPSGCACTIARFHCPMPDLALTNIIQVNS